MRLKSPSPVVLLLLQLLLLGVAAEQLSDGTQKLVELRRQLERRKKQQDHQQEQTLTLVLMSATRELAPPLLDNGTAIANHACMTVLNSLAAQATSSVVSHSSPPLQASDFWVQAALVNARYAVLHGYAFAYLQLRRETHAPSLGYSSSQDSGWHSCWQRRHRWKREAS